MSRSGQYRSGFAKIVCTCGFCSVSASSSSLCRRPRQSHAPFGVVCAAFVPSGAFRSALSAKEKSSAGATTAWRSMPSWPTSLSQLRSSRCTGICAPWNVLKSVTSTSKCRESLILNSGKSRLSATLSQSSRTGHSSRKYPTTTPRSHVLGAEAPADPGAPPPEPPVPSSEPAPAAPAAPSAAARPV